MNSFFESEIIIGGNPAKIIGHWDAFLEKNKQYALSRTNAKSVLLNHPEKNIVRKEAKRK